MVMNGLKLKLSGNIDLLLCKPVKHSVDVDLWLNRLNQLKTSGEESWKKRVNKEDIIDPDTPNIKLLTKRSLTPVRPSTIADRLTKLEVSSESWKVRVEETDAKRFTVASKISKTIVGKL